MPELPIDGRYEKECPRCGGCGAVDKDDNGVTDIEIIQMAHDIVDKELLPNVATMAIQDFGRLNEFMMVATARLKDNKKESQ